MSETLAFQPNPAELAHSVEAIRSDAEMLALARPVGEIAVSAVFATEGSLAATWKERSVASEQVESGMGTVNSKTGSGIGEIGYQDDYKVDQVPIAMPISGNEMQPEWYQKVADMSFDERILHGVTNLENIEVADFESLQPEVKQAIFTDRLRQIEHDSRDVESRRQAIVKNMQRLESGQVVLPGDYLHGFDSKNLKSILNTGLVAGEAVGVIDGRLPNSDRYPYNLDLLDAEIMGAVASDGALNIENTGGYGNVVAVVDRSEGATDHNNEVKPPEPGHKLILGGVPATEVRSLHIRPNSLSLPESQHEYEETIKETMNAIVSEGVYIPVYDGDGKLLLTYDDYVTKHQAHEYENDFQRQPYHESEVAEQSPDLQDRGSEIPVM